MPCMSNCNGPCRIARLTFSLPLDHIFLVKTSFQRLYLVDYVIFYDFLRSKDKTFFGFRGFFCKLNLCLSNNGFHI